MEPSMEVVTLGEDNMRCPKLWWSFSGDGNEEVVRNIGDESSNLR